MANEFRLDEAAIRELLSDERGPVGAGLRKLAERGADIARARAPRRTGHMTETVHAELGHDAYDGTLRAWFGAGYEAAIPHDREWKGGFPVINALEASDGFVWNRSPHGRPHTRGTRRTHPFLTQALDVLAGEF